MRNRGTLGETVPLALRSAYLQDMQSLGRGRDIEDVIPDDHGMGAASLGERLGDGACKYVISIIGRLRAGL